MRQIPSFLFANEIIVVDPQFEVDIKKIPLCKKKVRTIRIGSNIVPSVAPNDKIIELHNSLVKDNMKLMSYFGFINEYKCFLELVEAIKHLKDAGKLKSKLVVIGELKESDEYHKKVLEKIREYNLDNDIIVTGYLKDSVGDYLKASDFAVLPFYYGISVRNGSFLAAYQEGIDIITTKGDKNFPYDDVYLMNDNTPQTIASAIEYYLEDVGIVGCLFTFGLVGVFLFLTFITKGMKTIISGYKDRSIFSDSVVLGVFMFLVFTMPTLFLFDYARNGFLMFVLLFMTPKSERN